MGKKTCLLFYPHNNILEKIFMPPSSGLIIHSWKKMPASSLYPHNPVLGKIACLLLLAASSIPGKNACLLPLPP